ncbi:MAG: phytanoyl-CoA dioxygenase [Rhodospirillaceae bacterium]|nr:phytanoyl-CoA dioxygenase [Rhodospirillaceae bacterium]|tara:strand:+ start:2704 stop:3846 length:1143 start_codon:yes stop_codon:yes gene_type:complete
MQTAGIVEKVNSVDLEKYMVEGAVRALELNNRGPFRRTSTGLIDPEILDSYWRYGFYIFEEIFGEEELNDLMIDIEEILDRLPTNSDSKIDAKGRPALAANCKAKNLYWSKPLGDPWGGTSFGQGRHAAKMFEPKPSQNSPEEIVFLILGSLQFSDACLRAYGHPDLMALSAAVNGDDFVPYTDGLFIKAPGLGASVAWHQDGITHWDSPEWNQGSHGFNLMGQVYGCTPENGVWVIPGSHKLGKIDIKAKIRQAGSIYFPDAVPMVCNPGDVVISNRQLLHGSFANTSDNWRVTVNMGCLPKRSVLGVRGGGIVSPETVFDEDHIAKRSRPIAYAIDARHQRFPEETPFIYEPLADQDIVWDQEARKSLHDYSLLDISI